MTSELDEEQSENYELLADYFQELDFELFQELDFKLFSSMTKGHDKKCATSWF